MRSELHMVSLSVVLTMSACGGPRTTESPPAAAPASADLSAGGVTGKVSQTMNAGNYTYVEVESAGKRLWAAAPLLAVKVGDTVEVPQGVPMTNFRSETLNRKFDVVYFVAAIHNLSSGPAASAAQPHGMTPHQKAAVARADMDFSGIQKPEGGKTVAEVYAEKATLAGQAVAVRGKVVKVTPSVMDRNWIHLQDGSGTGADSDLTVTSDAAAQVGDTVTARGVLAVDRDFGLGYRYAVIVEGAVLSK